MFPRTNTPDLSAQLINEPCVKMNKQGNNIKCECKDTWVIGETLFCLKASSESKIVINS